MAGHKPEDEADIYSDALWPMRRMMSFAGVAAPRLAVLQRGVTLLHTLAVCGLLGFCAAKYYDKVSAVWDVPRDNMSAVLDILGYGSLLGLHLVVELESNWCARAHDAIFAALARLRPQYARFWQRLPPTPGRPQHQTRPDVRRYCRQVYALQAVCFAGLLALVVVVGHLGIDMSRMPLSVYSELLVRLKLFEFMLFAALVRALLQELLAAGAACLRQLAQSRYAVRPSERLGCLECVVLLQDIHSEVWRAMRAIEQYFNWSLPGLLAKLYVDLTLLGYWMYIGMSSGGNTAVYAVFCCGNLLLQLLMIFAAFYMCSACEILGRRFRSLFFTLESGRQHRALAACLRRMSLQLMHEPIYFNAGGFVLINCATFGRFLFMMITCMVILIQFRMSV